MTTPRSRQKTYQDCVGNRRPTLAAEPDLLEETRAIWQKRAQRRLTREDAREIVENVVGFFDVLHEWNLAEHNGGRGKGKR